MTLVNRRKFSEFEGNVGNLDLRDHDNEHQDENCDMVEEEIGRRNLDVFEDSVGVDINNSTPSKQKSFERSKEKLKIASRDLGCERPVKKVRYDMGFYRNFSMGFHVYAHFEKLPLDANRYGSEAHKFT